MHWGDLMSQHGSVCLSPCQVSFDYNHKVNFDLNLITNYECFLGVVLERLVTQAAALRKIPRQLAGA